MSEIKTKPEIRFSGFTNVWEQQSLSEVMSEFIVPMRDKPKEFSGDIPWTRIEDIEGKYLNGSLSGQYVSEKTINEMNLKIIPKGALIVSASATFGVVAVVTKDLITNQTFIGLVPQKSFDMDFLYTFFQSNTVQQKMRIESAGSTIFYIARQTFEDMQFAFPNRDEQRKIGTFFATLDHLVTIHQREYDKTVNIKKAMLEKMFPKEGADKPEIRFAGFTDAWEQRKLSKFVDFFSGLTYTPNDVRSSGTLVLRSSNVRDGEIIDADNVYVAPEVANSENVKEGDIIVVVRNGSRALIGKHAEIKIFMPNTVIGAFMTGLRSEHSPFINALLNTSHFDKEVAMNMGATINQITGYMFSKMEFMIPSVDEQDAIGEYFKHLDHLITLHQRELEKLQNIKKSLLEKMFI